MVVLHPNHISRLTETGNDVGEAHVCFTVREPVGRVEVHLSGVVVEQGPQDGVGEAFSQRGPSTREACEIRTAEKHARCVADNSEHGHHSTWTPLNAPL